MSMFVHIGGRGDLLKCQHGFFPANLGQKFENHQDFLEMYGNDEKYQLWFDPSDNHMDWSIINL